MALIVNQQTNLKHFCRICKKGFGCGRALGGHMRAHGIGDESGHLDDEDQASDWEDDKLGGNSATNNVPPTNKRMYALRTNPNRLKSCRVCENCGKEFLSWKSFLEHGKCSSDDAESLISSPGSDHEHDHDHDITRTQGCTGWSKRKRSFRACKIGNNNNNNLISTITTTTTTSYCPCSEEEDLANCLMMLSNATVNPDLLVVEPEESCASASKDQDQERRNNTNNYSNPKNFINPSNSCRFQMNNNDNNNYKAKVVANKGLFECKACKKVFNSHQALGGHRASHKKVKGCFAARLDHHNHDSIADDDVITHEEFFPTKLNSISLQQFQQGGSNDNVPTTLVGSSSNKKKLSKVHECSICHRIFSSGQALGGHKRCHWITSNAPDTSTLAKFHQFQENLDHMNMNQRAPNSSKFEKNLEPLDLKLDLNLPAPPPPPPPPVVVHPNVLNPTTFQVSTEIYLQPWISGNKDQAQEDNYYRQRSRHRNNDENDKNNLHIQNNNDNNNNSNGSMQNLDDEADSNKVKKLAKLSELKDITMSEGSSHWLQVGIGTSTDVRPDP